MFPVSLATYTIVTNKHFIREEIQELKDGQKDLKEEAKLHTRESNQRLDSVDNRLHNVETSNKIVETKLGSLETGQAEIKQILQNKK